MASELGADAQSLLVKEIYRSIQGESSFAGWPCSFVRTTGCDLRCVYCDEQHAFRGGERLSLDEVVKRVEALGVSGQARRSGARSEAEPSGAGSRATARAPGRARLVEITGGEPLLQRAVPGLARRLLDSGYEVLIESGGHRDITEIDPRARLILDVKTPGSGMVEHNHLENLARLRDRDELKFVLCDRADYEWARRFVREHPLDARIPVHFSPVHPGLDPAELCAWILEDGLPVRLNLQLHKYIWGPDARGV